MRYLALAMDYDGTVAQDGVLSTTAGQAIARLPQSGRRAVLVTGRRLDDLRSACPQLRLFDMVVAENGAVLFDPKRQEESVLTRPVPEDFAVALRERGVTHVETGQVHVATSEQYRHVVADTIRELGLELQMISNRNVLMVLPSGVNKATGLQVALRRLGLSWHEAVGIGASENDHSLIAHCECAVAVANAIDSLKQVADVVTGGGNGDGIREIVDELIATDLERMAGKIERHLLLIGTREDGSPVRLPPYGHNVLVAGPSGSGKSTLTTSLIERLIEKNYQVCIVDPEGDYSTLESVIPLGTQQRAPSVSEALAILEDPSVNLSLNLLGLSLEDRPFFFSQLIPGLQAMRARTGRPHWIVLDEAHHMLPQTWGHGEGTLPRKLGETILVTVHPDHVVPDVLEPIDIVFAIGQSPKQTLERFARTVNKLQLDFPPSLDHQPNRVVAWFADEPPFSMQPQRCRAERIRHHRKYAEGDLRYHSFYFRGPDCRHNLKAQNLAMFCQIAAGIDEPTWLFHLHEHDYSQWIRGAVKDPVLADIIESIERRTELSSQQSRDLVRQAISSRYTLPDC